MRDGPRVSIAFPDDCEDPKARKQKGVSKAEGPDRRKGRNAEGGEKEGCPDQAKAAAFDALTAPVKGATKRDIGHVHGSRPRGRGPGEAHDLPAGISLGRGHETERRHRALHARPRRFLARGYIHIEYADGCIVEHKAPQIVAIDLGHDGWVVGKEPVILIEFDFEGDTVGRLGMPAAHRHE